MSTHEIDLIHKSNINFLKGILLNKLRLNEIYFNHGIFNEVEFNSYKFKMLKEFNDLENSLNDLKVCEVNKIEC